MRILIMGSGAIGSLYGGLLSLAGEDVIAFVGRKRHVDSIQANGLKIKGVKGEYSIPINATDDPRAIGNVDLIFITTKAYDSVKAAFQVSYLVDKGAYILCLHNGIGIEEKVAQDLGTTRVLRATTCMGAKMTGLGEVTITGDGITEVGSHYPENKVMVERVVSMMRNAGFDICSSNNIDGVVWTKAIVNCGLNPIAALTGLSNGEIHQNVGLRRLVIHLVKETAMVAKALNIKLNTENPIRYTLGTAKATAKNINSMLQDIQARKRTEIESITGEVIRQARKLDISIPFSEL